MSLQQRSTKEFRETVKFFGEKQETATTEDFFGIFAAFIMNFEVSNLKIRHFEKAEFQFKKLGLRSSHCRTDYRIVEGRLRGR